jgi:hypothetical protein
MDIEKLLKQKTTWTGAGLIITTALPFLGVPAHIIKGLQGVLAGLMVIFLRQGIQKVQDKS